MNLILENVERVPYFTNMRSVMDALRMDFADFDWFISDIETNYYGDEFLSDDQWIAGAKLKDFLSRNEVQFIWAVFSAVVPGCRAKMDAPPYIDGNPDYWHGEEVGPQLHGALFEIACWDSSAVILVGVPDEAANSFRSAYPETAPLSSRGTSANHKFQRTPDGAAE
jgi:hypothetical protein